MTIEFCTWSLGADAHALLLAGDRTAPEIGRSLHLHPAGIRFHFQEWRRRGWVETYRCYPVHRYRLTDYGRSLKLIHCGSNQRHKRCQAIAQILDRYKGQTIRQVALAIGVRWDTTKKAIAVLIEAGIAERLDGKIYLRSEHEQIRKAG